MENMYPDRIFLHLIDSSEDIELVKNILESPLGLASKIIEQLFEERLEEFKDDLDKIKQFVAGIARAQTLSSSYALASYYPSMFAFHQHIHSSFRARQGKVLEKMIENILRQYGQCEVPTQKNEKLSILREIFDEKELPNLDIDVMGVDSTNKKTILIQLRSRDDTGGTTAKGSLVEFLRELLRLNKIPKNDILYLVCIWDARDAQQKTSTVKKMFSALQGSTAILREDFDDVMEKEIELRENIFLKMAYGTDQIEEALFEWIGDVEGG